jgi:hypothetical protein
MQLLKSFSTFYGTRRFITVFTRALDFFPVLSQINPVDPTPSYSLRSILILSTYRRLGLPGGLFPSGFLTNILYVFLFPFVLHALPISSSLTHHSNYSWRRVQVMKLLVGHNLRKYFVVAYSAYYVFSRSYLPS